ncbi:hypothetical protein [Pseudonocardia sp.]|uniref:hypothetical protein n=1 Tax=Pseudonocardia sp. TaxID=60912 RepID=UPI0026252B96|nr:hypothetical protein [Pseudonocardia sp.]
MHTTVDLPDLAALPPGPGLAAALEVVQLSAVPNDRMLEVLAAQHRQLCHEQARTAAVVAEVGRCTGSPEPGEVARLAAPQRYAPEETRAALRWTRRSAEWEHDLAETVVHTMPQLHAAWLAGVVDRPRVLVFDRYLTGLTRDQITAICAKAVPLAPTRTTGQLAVLLRRMVLAVDPAAAERWYRKGIRERNVTAITDHDGTVAMTAHGLPADDAEAACTRVQDLAASAKRAGHPGLIGQIRCDLFLGLLDGRFHAMTTAQVVAALIKQYRPDGGPTAATGDDRPASGTGPAPTGGPGTAAAAAAPSGGTDAAATGAAATGIEVRVALSTLLGHDELPGEIPGLGLLPAPATRARVALQRRAQWRFAVTDDTGRLLSEGITRRRPHTVGEHPVHRHGPTGGIVEIHIPAALLAQPAEDGSGAWAGVIADIAAQHARRDAHLTDLDARRGDRLPHAALRRHTEIRDRTCRFPGCRRRAHATDTDHTHEHAADGDTTTTNTGPLCNHDHDVKHRGGWTLTQPEPGVFVWHSPLGGRYTTRGEFLLPDLPDPQPVDLGPHFDVPTRRIEGPILQPHHRVEPPRPPPPAPRPELPDDPPF